ncbi:MAG TPA: hypothetical protein GYA10_09190 [Alphaproteobacteria bacterium]|nr:hypothetical protein [Alphaproteobacteria bacterium]
MLASILPFILIHEPGILLPPAHVCNYIAMGLPSTVFIMTSFIRTPPSPFECAARLHVASAARIVWPVMPQAGRRRSSPRSEISCRSGTTPSFRTYSSGRGLAGHG